MVQYRNPLLVFLLTIVTIGIYGLYWLAKTCLELKGLAKKEPDVFYVLLLIVPGFNLFIGFYFFWKYSAAIADISGVNHFLLYVTWLLPPVAMAISQVALNKFAPKNTGREAD